MKSKNLFGTIHFLKLNSYCGGIAVYVQYGFLYLLQSRHKFLGWSFQSFANPPTSNHRGSMGERLSKLILNSVAPQLYTIKSSTVHFWCQSLIRYDVFCILNGLMEKLNYKYVKNKHQWAALYWQDPSAHIQTAAGSCFLLVSASSTYFKDRRWPLLLQMWV